MKDKKPKKDKVEEPASLYEKTKSQGIGKDFDFEKEFESGLTPEQFKVEMAKRIKSYPWKK
ncbi:MAG: hypothetical protein ACK4UK_01345 [Flavobacterium sp.]